MPSSAPTSACSQRRIHSRACNALAEAEAQVATATATGNSGTTVLIKGSGNCWWTQAASAGAGSRNSDRQFWVRGAGFGG